MAKYRFGDICEVLNGRAYKQNELLSSGKYPILRVGNFFSSDRWYYSDMELPENKYCDYEDLLFAWSASFGPKIWDGGKVIYHYHIWKLIPNDDVADKFYLYYWLRHSVNRLTAGTHGSVMAHMTKGDMENQSIELPSLQTQKKISSILRTIDEKIHNNEAINNNLLEQALTLYTTQFATLERNGCVGDYCSIKSGFAFKSSWWTHNGVKVIKIGSISQDNLNLLECSYVDEDKIDKAKDFKVGAGDLLIAMTGATIGKFAMVPYSSEMLLVNQRVGKFFLGDNPVEKLPFIYCTLKQPEVYYEIVNRGQGSAQPNISASDIMSIPCVIPSKERINEFNDTAQPLFDLIISNQRENQQLSELRDSLLPKLMSGELDVSDLDL